MVLSRRWFTQSKVVWMFLSFASFYLIMILLQTDNPYKDESEPEDQQSTRDITVKFDGSEVNSVDKDDLSSKPPGATYEKALSNISPGNLEGNRVIKSAMERIPGLMSGSLREKKEVRTPDIPYETFLPPPGLSRVPHIRVLNNLPEKYQNIGFLKNKLSYENIEDAIPELSTHGDPSEMNCNDTYCYINGRTLKREIIIENPKDMFKFLPPEEEFLKEFKNPCWKGKDIYDRENLFCLPYFFIIGFTKCGTTDLFAILNSHILISSRATKETHFFDRWRRGRTYRMYQPAINEPRSFMYHVNRGSYRNVLMRSFQEIEGTDVLFHGITMDATPSYVWDNEYWETFHHGYKEPPVTNADTIANLNPKTKIIFSLRDPINRMRSAYQFFCAVRAYNCDKPITPEKYNDLVVEAVEKFNNCLKNNTVRGCTYSTETHQLATHLYASIYHVYIMDFMKVFPRDQLYLLQMEEHISDPITSVNKICDFLEIQQFPDKTIRSFLDLHSTRNKLNDAQKLPYVLPETIEILEKFFKPYLRDLVNLLGDEKWYWNRPH